MTLYSIGHSNTPLERLIELLQLHTIALLADVRSMPYSRYNPQFNRELLAAGLRDAGVSYRFMGQALGGKPADEQLRRADGSFDYAAIAATPLFQQGLAELIALGQQQSVAFMCSEADYRICHRHRLITPELLAQGLAVWHILPTGQLEQGRLEPEQLTLF